MRRTVLGILAVICLVGGVALLWFGPADETYLMFGSSGLRIGLVLGAFWLAYPQLSYVPWWFVQALLVGAVVVAVRPRMALIVLPLLLTIWLIRPRKRKEPSRKRRASTPSRAPRAN
jgi:hypothetical protein